MAKLDKKKSRLITRTVILLVLASVIIFSLVNKKEVKVLAVGDMAPDFELVDLEGTKHKLSDYRGQGVFLNFWGSWCGPCKREMPFMENQYHEYKDKGVQILAVNINDSEFKVENFRDQYGLSFPIVMDKNKSVMDIYNVKPLPTTILIDKDGKITGIEISGMKEDKIRALMESIRPK